MKNKRLALEGLQKSSFTDVGMLMISGSILEVILETNR